MTYDDIIAVLGFAGGHDRRVKVLTRDRTEIIGIPTSIDTHLTAHEVYIRPDGVEDTEIAVSLAQIEAVDLIETF